MEKLMEDNQDGLVDFFLNVLSSRERELLKQIASRNTRAMECLMEMAENDLGKIKLRIMLKCHKVLLRHTDWDIYPQLRELLHLMKRLERSGQVLEINSNLKMLLSVLDEIDDSRDLAEVIVNIAENPVRGIV